MKGTLVGIGDSRGVRIPRPFIQQCGLTDHAEMDVTEGSTERDKMRIEEERLDVMQNLEFAVARVYRQNPTMTDYAVARTYEALLRAYSSEITGRPLKPATPEGVEVELLQQEKQMCEWRLGRSALFSPQDQAPECEPLDVPTLILCLKRLVKSVNTWTKQRGRQGYLNFMTQFVR